jgi:aerobic carbon-monoxide dehydrogenase medium subunit
VTRVHEPETVADAVGMLSSLGGEGAVLAGGTWVMRAPLRREAHPSDYVALRRIGELREIASGDGEVRIGALATHVELGTLDDGTGPLGALAEAGRRSAFPAVRNVATLGGNLAAPFPAADLVPPLLAAEAAVEVARAGGTEVLDLAAWLGGPRRRDEVVVAVRVPAPPGRRAWFERLTVRSGAEYSVASVAVSVDVDLDAGAVAAARVAVGAVEPVPLRVPAAEAVLAGRPLDEASAAAAGRAASDALSGRDELDAPGWYRLAVLPALIGRAIERLSD